MALKYIQLYYDYLDAVEPLSDAERGRLFTSLLEYGKTGVTQGLSGNERFIFPMMKAQVDRDNTAYDEKSKINSENGKMGGRPQKTKKAAAFSKTEKSQDKEKNKDKDKDDIYPAAANAHVYDAEFNKAIAYYQNKIDVNPGEGMLPEMHGFIQIMNADVVICAIDKAIAENKRKWSYIKGILKGWERAGIKNMTDVARERSEWENRKNRQAASAMAKSKPPRLGDTPSPPGEAERKAIDWIKNYKPYP